jgi:DNA-binding response OmpR family regulator
MKPVPSLRFLVVEDEALLAMDLEMMIEDAGHRVVGEAVCLADMDRLDDDLDPEVAFVDIQLADGSSGLDVCQQIRERWPSAIVIFVTANPKMATIGRDGGHGLIAKPFSRAGFIAAMRYLTKGISDPPPDSEPPPALSLSGAVVAAWSKPRETSRRGLQHWN